MALVFKVIRSCGTLGEPHIHVGAAAGRAVGQLGRFGLQCNYIEPAREQTTSRSGLPVLYHVTANTTSPGMFCWYSSRLVTLSINI